MPELASKSTSFCTLFAISSRRGCMASEDMLLLLTTQGGDSGHRDIA
jgi:hypothetical protein